MWLPDFLVHRRIEGANQKGPRVGIRKRKSVEKETMPPATRHRRKRQNTGFMIYVRVYCII